MLALCALPLSAAAQTHYYVDAAIGDDSRSAVQAQNSATPWLTITHAGANLTVGPLGTIVHVAPGTYQECVQTGKSSGVSGVSDTQRVVFQSDTPYAAHVVSKACLMSWNHGSGTDYGAFTDIIGFDVTAGADGPANTCIGIGAYPAHVRVIGNRVHDIPALGAVCTSAGAGINNGIYTATYPAYDTGNITSGNLVDGVGYANGSCSQIHGIYHSSPSGIIQNNVVSRACGWGIHINHLVANEIVAHNVVMENLRGGIILASENTNGMINDYCTVNNNIVVNNHGSAGHYGIEEAYATPATGSHNVYFNNLFYRNTPTTGCANPPSGISGCPYDFQYGPRSVGQTVQLNADQFAGLFVSYTGNALTGNYHLAQASAAIGAGTNGNCADGVTSCMPTTDFDGHPISNPPSIGAYNFLADVAPDAGTTDGGSVSTDAGTTDGGSVSTDAAVVGAADAGNFNTKISGSCGCSASTAVENCGVFALTLGLRRRRRST